MGIKVEQFRKKITQRRNETERRNGTQRTRVKKEKKKRAVNYAGYVSINSIFISYEKYRQCAIHYLPTLRSYLQLY